ncbi:MAG TPA: hypothetical protein VN478_05020 [Clostridia bacterium]|nr:hypothetical protein [Clostridia bacterium]
MELNKDRGPIYSNYDRDRSRDYSPVIDYAAPPRSSEEMEFMLAHKIAPGVAEAGDMQSATTQRYQSGTAPLPAFLQALSDSMAQRTQGQAGNLQSPAQQKTSWSYQGRTAHRNQSQSKAALIGVLIWVLFILASMLMSIFGR